MNQPNDPQIMETSQDKETAKRNNWSSFVEGEVVNFFEHHDLEKIAIEDGNGNKAKLSRTRDEEIKVEYSTTTFL